MAMNRRNFLKNIFRVGGALAFPGISRTFAQTKEEVPHLKARETQKEKPFSAKPQSTIDHSKTIVYRSGLSGEELARAYGVEYTPSPIFKPPKELMHDIKVMVVGECKKYNEPCEINPKGETLVDPYRVLAIFSVESGFNPNASYKQDGKGLGQLTQITLRDIEVLPQAPVKVTDVFDPGQNIAGTVRYLIRIHKDYLKPGERTAEKIMQIYHRGPVGVLKPKNKTAIETYAKKIDTVYWRLKSEKALKNYKQ